MKEIAVGIAMMWLVATLFKRPITVKGLPNILFALLIAWGLGCMFFGVFK